MKKSCTITIVVEVEIEDDMLDEILHSYRETQDGDAHIDDVFSAAANWHIRGDQDMCQGISNFTTGEVCYAADEVMWDTDVFLMESK